MKVLFPFVGETIGGSHQSAALLMAALPALGIQPLALVHRPGPLADFLAGHGIPTTCPIDLPLWDTGGGPLTGLARLAAVTPAVLIALRRLDADVVHVNDGRMAVTWAPATRLAGRRLVVHQRTRLAPSRLSSLALSLADSVIAISNYTRDSLPTGARAKAQVLANPFATDVVDRAAARARLADELGVAPERPVLAFVGTLQRQKRPLVALEALASLRAQGSRALLLMAGRATGAEAEAVSMFIDRAGLADSVRVLGFRTDVTTILAGVDALLAPAVNEGHGRALVEAMLTGTPVVAARSGGHGEIVCDGETGNLVPPDDPAALAAAVGALLANPARAGRLAAAARAEALARFSVSAHAGAVASLYRRLVER